MPFHNIFLDQVFIFLGIQCMSLYLTWLVISSQNHLETIKEFSLQLIRTQCSCSNNWGETHPSRDHCTGILETHQLMTLFHERKKLVHQMQLVTFFTKGCKTYDFFSIFHISTCLYMNIWFPFPFIHGKQYGKVTN